MRILQAHTCITHITRQNKKNKFVPTCDGSTPTYESGINTLLEDNCFASHAEGSGNTVYTGYESMQYSFDDGSFESEVLLKQQMPEGKKCVQSKGVFLIYESVNTNTIFELLWY